MNLNYFLSYFRRVFRARPELVEGFPRALEDILQQVQDERERKDKDPSNYLHSWQKDKSFIM